MPQMLMEIFKHLQKKLFQAVLIQPIVKRTPQFLLLMEFQLTVIVALELPTQSQRKELCDIWMEKLFYTSAIMTVSRHLANQDDWYYLFHAMIMLEYNYNHLCFDIIVYRFPEPLDPSLTTEQREVAKESWKGTLEVKCGWGKQWDPPEVQGCVDPRGCR